MANVKVVPRWACHVPRPPPDGGSFGANVVTPPPPASDVGVRLGFTGDVTGFTLEARSLIIPYGFTLAGGRLLGDMQLLVAASCNARQGRSAAHTLTSVTAHSTSSPPIFEVHGGGQWHACYATAACRREGPGGAGPHHTPLANPGDDVASPGADAALYSRVPLSGEPSCLNPAAPTASAPLQFAHVARAHARALAHTVRAIVQRPERR
jgi:hypothetical protein